MARQLEEGQLTMAAGASDRTRVLFVVQNFRQGWGGAPESVRLMAQQLLGRGVDSDVFDAGFIRRDVGQLDVLPEPTVLSEAFPLETTADYAAILLTGPWQKATAIHRLIARRRKAQPVFYLPRGGLGRVEFARLRDLKKIPYFFAIERAFVHGATGVIYSSETERRHTIGPARRRSSEHIIPDIVAPPRDAPHGVTKPAGPVTFAFLAEVSPRKGLLPLVEGFRAFSAGKPEGAVRLIIGGRPRPGSEAYLARAEAAAVGAPVEFRGAIAHQNRASFYGETDVMVVASSFESYGLTVIEALSEGCALVSTPQVGALEYVDAPDVVTVAAGDDARSIADALETAYVQVTRPTARSREAVREVAASTVAAINTRALDSRMALFAA